MASIDGEALSRLECEELDAHAQDSQPSVTPNGRAAKKRKTASWIWSHSTKVEGDKVMCSECVSNGRMKPSVFASTSGNSSLSRHLRVAHRIEKGITNDVHQTTISNQALLVRHNVMSDHDKHAAISALARLIVDAKLSFRLVKSPAFREFTRSLNKFFPTISRRTLGRCIQDEYDAALPRIKTAISNISGLVALPCDGWSSRVFRGYFVVTIHWITPTFDIQSLSSSSYTSRHLTTSTIQGIYC
jgi:hypothetical protein